MPDVLSKFEFEKVIKRMVESNTLYLTIKELNSDKGYLDPDKIERCGRPYEIKVFNIIVDEGLFF